MSRREDNVVCSHSFKHYGSIFMKYLLLFFFLFSKQFLAIAMFIPRDVVLWNGTIEGVIIIYRHIDLPSYYNSMKAGNHFLLFHCTSYCAHGMKIIKSFWCNFKSASHSKIIKCFIVNKNMQGRRQMHHFLFPMAPSSFLFSLALQLQR